MYDGLEERLSWANTNSDSNQSDGFIQAAILGRSRLFRNFEMEYRSYFAVKLLCG